MTVKDNNIILNRNFMVRKLDLLETWNPMSQSIAIFSREPIVSSSSKSHEKLTWIRRIRDAKRLDTLDSGSECRVLLPYRDSIFQQPTYQLLRGNIYVAAIRMSDHT
ncbi:hypothetical protein AHAS_Ahas08G0042700 [Arachis hypogaea]